MKSVNSIKNRKCAHAKDVLTTFDGEVKNFTKKKLVYDFEIIGDVDSKTVKRYLPYAQIYTAPGNQETLDYLIDDKSLRNMSCDMFNAKAKNLKKYGMFKTNYEVIQSSLKENTQSNLLNYYI